MRTISINLYKFDELSDKAKEVARQWWRDNDSGENKWAEYVLEDAKTCLALMGFCNVDIQWSGFWCQGDGASFTGHWQAETVAPTALKQHAPVDEELHRIVDGLYTVAQIYPDGYVKLSSDSQMCCHEGTITFDHCSGFDKEGWGVSLAALIGLSRNMMRWIYRQLESEYNYYVSDENVDESIRINEHEFYDNGSYAWRHNQ